MSLPGTNDKLSLRFPIEKIIELSVVSEYYEDTYADEIQIKSYNLVSFEKWTLKI